MESLILDIKYFNKEKFIECYNKWMYYNAMNRVAYHPVRDSSWNSFFEIETKYCEIIDEFEYKSRDAGILSIKNAIHRIYILENDFLWNQVYPSFENGIMSTKINNQLYSISSLMEASNTYKMYGEKEEKFGESWFLNDVYKTLQREIKINQLIKIE